MKVIETALPGVLIIEPKVFGDHRGFFLETFQVDRYREAGITLPFVQDNHSRSQRGVLRGLHFQKTRPRIASTYIESRRLLRCLRGGRL